MTAMPAIIELRDIRERHPASPPRAGVQIGDRVLVSTPNGLEEAMVVEMDVTVEEDISMKIIRVLNDDDKRVIEENKVLVQQILPQIIMEIEKDSLDMHFTSAAYTYDRQKLFIYYTACERVDFRNLIKSLGTRFKVRIQMVQIGARVAASILGGLGLCGRKLCCSGFLKVLGSVNIDMARNQHLSLNPEGISGYCGRLICCLRYENDLY